ncbi:hypothetical protein Gorai_011551 [Gossypium raimondii]|uniref:Uncharacterized protein n=8 Tax=Gossypium TaxID=3633 RepID=A0A0D2RXE5_GOSRA|nr:hypothetical protein B456_009G104100 [Gossypium raimondii]KJB55889.1 hypothetical protein B456_009G104100 [Gossypium raimondii]MBA0594653.1 hypothetical protein [Gossypium raimondii]
MATCPEKTKKKKTQFPPRRGRVKAQIFESIAKTVVSAASKTKEEMGKNKSEGYDGKSCSSSSTTSTPPQSGYTSEGNGHISWKTTISVKGQINHHPILWFLSQSS